MAKERGTTDVHQPRYSERGAAKHLGISVLTIRSYRFQGRITPLTTANQSGITSYSAQELELFAENWLPQIEFNRARVGWGVTRGVTSERNY